MCSLQTNFIKDTLENRLEKEYLCIEDIQVANKHIPYQYHQGNAN